jgi:hypothetical protein
MAEDDPEAVFAVASKIPDVGNPRVNEDLVDVCVALPPALAARLVPSVIRWLREPYQLLLPSKAGVLVSHLAREGEVEAASRLLKELLSLVRWEPPQLTEGEDEDEVFNLRPEARSRIDVWDYEKILEENVPDFVGAAGEQALSILCNVLTEAIRISGHGDDGPEDYSWIWRPAIEDHEQNHDRTAGDFLVSAARDAAVHLVEEGSPLSRILAALGRHPYYVFVRLQLHLLAKFPDWDPEATHQRLLDLDLFDLPQVSHELGALMKVAFGALSPDDKRELMARVETGPDLDAYEQRFERDEGRAPTEIELSSRRERWQLDKLGLFSRGDLPEEWRSRLGELAATWGPPEDDGFPFVMHSWTGDISPKSEEELSQLEPREVLELLREWVPTGDRIDATREGLGTVLTSIVKSAPKPFASVAGDFVGLDPVYVRSLIGGLQEATRAGEEFDWEPVLELSQWVLEQPRDIPNRIERYSDIDPGWVWTRKAIADLLEVGLASKGVGIPIELRGQTWAVLELLIADPDPEESDEAEGLRIGERSLNSVRGMALHGVFMYCRYVKMALDEADPEHEHSFTDMPEAESLLRERLRVALDPHPAIRAVHGWRFPLLTWIDEEWAREHRHEVFSQAEGKLDDLGWVAWAAYLRAARAYFGVFDILRPVYELAVSELEPTVEDLGSSDDPLVGLAHHLMTFYWHGKLALDDALLEGLFTDGSPGLRGQALHYVGRSLRDLRRAVPREVGERMIALWDSRISAAEAGDATSFAPEAAAFGWWFTSAKLPDQWAVENLVRALRVSNRTELDHAVMGRLSELASRFPGPAVDCAALLIEGDHQGWGVYSWKADLARIIAAAHASGEPGPREKAETVVNELVVRGYPEFREFIS